MVLGGSWVSLCLFPGLLQHTVHLLLRLQAFASWREMLWVEAQTYTRITAPTSVLSLDRRLWLTAPACRLGVRTLQGLFQPGDAPRKPSAPLLSPSHPLRIPFRTFCGRQLTCLSSSGPCRGYISPPWDASATQPHNLQDQVQNEEVGPLLRSRKNPIKSAAEIGDVAQW